MGSIYVFDLTQKEYSLGTTLDIRPGRVYRQTRNLYRNKFMKVRAKRVPHVTKV
jgi:hypothetical protein